MVESMVPFAVDGDASCCLAGNGPGDGALLCAGLAVTFLLRAPTDELLRGRAPRVAEGALFGT